MNWQTGFDEYEKVKYVLIKKYNYSKKRAEERIPYLTLEKFYKYYKEYDQYEKK